MRPSEWRPASTEIVQLSRVPHGDVDLGDVRARAQQLLVAHDELRVEAVAGAEEQVAADDPLTGEEVEAVARAFEPVAAGGEDLFALDDDVADGLACVAGELAAFVADALVPGGVGFGVCREPAVEHARHGVAVALGAETVVEAAVALFADARDAVVGIANPKARIGTRRRGPAEEENRAEQQQPYALRDGHGSLITYFPAGNVLQHFGRILQRVRPGAINR